jgi:hypothetical protein
LSRVLQAAEWRIPAERMKMRAPHIVPLSRQAVENFAELRSIAGRSGYVFPSPGAEGFMSNNTMLFAMYRMGFHGRATVHGFRAVASTLLNEMGFHPDWIERQLAHDERNKVRAAYNHAGISDFSRGACSFWRLEFPIGFHRLTSPTVLMMRGRAETSAVQPCAANIFKASSTASFVRSALGPCVRIALIMNNHKLCTTPNHAVSLEIVATLTL